MFVKLEYSDDKKSHSREYKQKAVQLVTARAMSTAELNEFRGLAVGKFRCLRLLAIAA